MQLTLLQRLSIRASDRKEWYRALGKIADDGLPLFDALERMGKDFAKTRHPMTPLVEILLMRLRGAGASKQGSGRRTTGTELVGMVPDDEAMLIQAGDMSGRHGAGFKNAANLVETKGKLMGAITGAMIKPLGYIAGMIGLLTFISVYLIPRFEKTRPRADWPDYAQLLGAVADHVWLLTASVIGLVVFAVVALKWLMPNWCGELRDNFDRRVFPFGLIASIQGASFLTSIAGYIGAGTPFVDAVKNMKASGTAYMDWQCGQLMQIMKSGKRAEEALCSLSIVPPRYHWIINVYAMSGDTAHAYETIAAEMVRSVQLRIEYIFVWFISNALLLTIGGMLFWIYSSMFGIAGAGNSGF